MAESMGTRWSPFDPAWYQQAFDKFISTADELFYQDEIIRSGFVLPDRDGSHSSVFHRDAILNNSFNEGALRQTLKDIYLNSTHRLKASNHDNVHYFQWHGTMSDMKKNANTDTCELSIPTETFIRATGRTIYKYGQYLKKWITLDDILNDWSTFQWHCLLFINRRIYTNYEFHIDDRETIIRFPYYDIWDKENYTVDLYKFDTNAQCRIKIGARLLEDNDWKLPIENLTDERILNHPRAVVSINRISNIDERIDGKLHVDGLGDNLEFCEIHDGYVDLSHLSDFNHDMIVSELYDYLHMSLFVPKFFHEYPIMLPVDMTYQSYARKLVPLYVMENQTAKQVFTTDTHNNLKAVYVDLNMNSEENLTLEDGRIRSDTPVHGYLLDEQGRQQEIANIQDRVVTEQQDYVVMNVNEEERGPGWTQMVRPIVLSDSFDNPELDPYLKYLEDLQKLREMTIELADMLEFFRFSIVPNGTMPEFYDYLEKVRKQALTIRDEHDGFLEKHRMGENETFHQTIDEFEAAYQSILQDGKLSPLLEIQYGANKDFWTIASPIVYIPRQLADRYVGSEYIRNMPSYSRYLWETPDVYLQQHRYRRPIDTLDFLILEYDITKNVWRPANMKIEHHFPDVYILTNLDGSVPNTNQIFKAFFFYSDTMNVREPSGPIVRPTPSYDEDMEEYMYDRGAVYRDIFMEKFYWMSIQTIYGGILYTTCRWEAIEYVINNPSYERFNKLFLQTMDPYFKMGLATYLKHNDFQFPFDYAIDKMKEGMNELFLGYQRVTNFEMYLDKDWVPSYFDYVTKILDDWDWESHIVYRPRDTMDMSRIVPVLRRFQLNLEEHVRQLLEKLDWILSMLQKEDYYLNVDLIQKLRDMAADLHINMKDALKLIDELDLQVDTVEDINEIIDTIRQHQVVIDEMRKLFEQVYLDATIHNHHEEKREELTPCEDLLKHTIPEDIRIIELTLYRFNVEQFLLGANDLRSYLRYDKENPDDISMLGLINDFENPWGVTVKSIRNQVYADTITLIQSFNPTKPYTSSELREFVRMIEKVNTEVWDLRGAIQSFCNEKDYPLPQDIIDRMDFTHDSLDELHTMLVEYIEARDRLISHVDEIKSHLNKLEIGVITPTENQYKLNLTLYLNEIISSISYLTGGSNIDNAKIHSNYTISEINNWLEYNEIEKSVFDAIFEVSGTPNPFLDAILQDQEMMNAVLEYLDTVNLKYIPLVRNPTYSEYYQITEIEMLSGGFLHTVGEEVYIIGLGVYKITGIEGNVATATLLEDAGYRKTQFNDPVENQNVYDSITNGSGMGITVRAIRSEKTLIKNDDVVTIYGTIAANVCNVLQRNTKSINPFKNHEVENLITQIEEADVSWHKLLEVYSDYMYRTGINAGNMIIDSMKALIPPLQEFMTARDKVIFEHLLQSFSLFRNNVNQQYEATGQDTPNYNLFRDRLREVYQRAAMFYGTGTAWEDEAELLEILGYVEYELELFHRKVMVEMAIPGLEEEEQRYLDMNQMIADIRVAVEDLKVYPPVLDPIIEDLVTRTTSLPLLLQKDVWHRMIDPNIADAGTGYRIGDIVEIVPELPTDEFGQPIHDHEDIVLNDHIFFQITNVDSHGGVLNARPIMEYATEYLIWGPRKTITKVGNGSGLLLDCYSYEITASDLKWATDPDSYVPDPDPFNSTDMFVFRFQNEYDLPITYEVFLAGKQSKDVIVRHVKSEDPNKPGYMDLVYVNANEVMALQDSVVHKDAEHYFIYKIDNFELLDPGAGYAVGQDIYVDAGEMALQLKIAKLDGTPYNGIAEIDMDQSILSYSQANPNSAYAEAVPQQLNNIDDEYNNSYYDQLDSEGIRVASTRSFPLTKYNFFRKRIDDNDDQNRNLSWMYPDVELPPSDDDISNGDPDEHFYLGDRLDNSLTGDVDPHRWNGMERAQIVTDGIVKDEDRIPPDQPLKGEYQLIDRKWFHTEKHMTEIIRSADLYVPTYERMPKSTATWPEAEIGKSVMVESDETHGGHRMKYTLKSFLLKGYFVWSSPILADRSCNSFDIDFMNIDCYQDFPSLKAQYPTANWDAKRFDDIETEINDTNLINQYEIEKRTQTYIAGLTVRDLSVYNRTERHWEDLSDTTRWKLTVRNDDVQKDWGFTLEFLEPGDYSCDMMLYLNKTPSSQTRNMVLKRNAVFDIQASIVAEVNNPKVDSSVNTGRHLRIRKLFPYDQKETYTVTQDQKEMEFELTKNYRHFMNEVHREDIKLYNKSAGRFEDLYDSNKYEIQYFNPKGIERGYETNTIIAHSYIGTTGTGFMPGECWCYNPEFDTHIFGYITTEVNTGHILTFTPIHVVHAPQQDIALEFALYQNGTRSTTDAAKVMIEFQTIRSEVASDGWIHNVENRLAPVPGKFKIVCKYDIAEPMEMEIIIAKTPRTWTFIEPSWIMSPTFHLDQQVPNDRLYIMTDKGRFPLVNPSTGKPSMRITETVDGTDVTFLNLYRRYEAMQIHSTPYPMRSVYVKRRVPEHGYIDLTGKLNKPLSKKYFEFWMNGRLLHDEVTIISPTKLILHGLKSLRNFEIIEVNRDANEYFSDDFLSTSETDLRPSPTWNYETYLDGALTGTLPGDNYTTDEQEALLTPVWTQVAKDHPEFKNYPPNMDTEDDILSRVEEEDYPLEDLEMPSYQYMIIDVPTLEGVPLSDRNMRFEHFGFVPISNEKLSDMMNDEWADEIANGQVPSHNAISDDEWYGLTTRLYDEYGVQVHNLNDSVYKVVDTNLLRINADSKANRIIRRNIEYDLT